MSPDVLQQTLDGGEQHLRDIEKHPLPDTFLVCPACGVAVLRSRQFDHEHDIRALLDERAAVDDGDDDEDDGLDSDEVVGHWYDITLSYSVDYRFRIPAYSDHDAEDRAEDLQLDARPADSRRVHTEKREGKDITGSDVPDDWDPYGSERLWEVLG